MKIYLMRHSETDWNRQGRTQGQTDIHLNENGRKIASLCGDGMKDIPIDLCISSPLSRARETAELVLRENTRFNDEGRIFKTDKRLLEVNFGEWEGLLAAPSKGLIDVNLLRRYFREHDATYTPKGAETIAYVSQRTRNFLGDIARDTALRDKNILVMSHGCAIRCMLGAFSGDPDYFNNMLTPLNCETYIIESDPKGKLILTAQNIFYYDKNLAEDLYGSRSAKEKLFK